MQKRIPPSRVRAGLAEGLGDGGGRRRWGVQVGAKGQEAGVQGGVVSFLGVEVFNVGVFVVDVLGRSCRGTGGSGVCAVFVVAILQATFHTFHKVVVEGRRFWRNEKVGHGLGFGSRTQSAASADVTFSQELLSPAFHQHSSNGGTAYLTIRRYSSPSSAGP